jgi:hypothetical protein
MCKKLRVVHCSQNSFFEPWVLVRENYEVLELDEQLFESNEKSCIFLFKPVYSFTQISVSFPCARHKKAYSGLECSSSNS